MHSDLETKIHGFIAERLKRLGAREGGLYSYYANFVTEGRGLSRYDVPILEFLQNNAERYEVALDVGAGIGQLSALLANKGFKTVAIEHDPRRYAAMCDLLAAHAPTVQTIFGRFPEVGRDLCRPTTLVIFTSFLTREVETAQPILAAAFECGGIILDLSRFVIPRDTDEERAELVRLIRQAGYDKTVEILNVYLLRYVYFRKGLPA